MYYYKKEKPKRNVLEGGGKKLMANAPMMVKDPTEK